MTMTDSPCCCPLCGGPNRCVPAGRGNFDAPCWCEEASFSPALLALVPAAQRGVACICAACAGAASIVADEVANAIPSDR